MEITEELCREIIALKFQSFKTDPDTFLALIKKVAGEYNVSYTVLLKMIYDKDFLFSQLNPEMEKVANQIEAISLEIKDLTEQLTFLMEYKNVMASTICDVYGHTLEVRSDGMLQCNMCGVEMTLEEDNTLETIRR